uniref:DUF2695 domain-containing protein n=1 Tax=Rhabditophanes sp. KR3021 TaxID=114890 RepID=A0AC35U993_9BILA
MAPRTEQYKEFNKRIRRTLHYGDQRIFTLTLPLSEMIVEYFSLYPTKGPFSMEFAVNLSKESCLERCTMLVAMIYIDRIRKGQLYYLKFT